MAIELTPSRSALLELKEDRDVMREGHAFLDEKRTVVAAELVLEMKRYARLRKDFDAAFAQAVHSLQRAVVRHGVEGLQCYPAGDPNAWRLRTGRRALLGIPLIDATFALAESAAPSVAGTTMQGEACRAAFRDLLALAGSLASVTGNLARLYQDYQKTERRTRALEDVLIPELNDAVQELETLLEAAELEEALRVRSVRR